MLSRFRNRLMTTMFVVFALLFAQLATAAYACPSWAGSAPVAGSMASGSPCDGMDAAKPALCHEHAAGTAAAFEAVKVPVVSLPAIVQVLVLPIVPDWDEAVVMVIATAVDVRPAPDPLFLSTLRLRV
jgi:hypothetical protein